ncbi:helix-turn-helix domain-containing protein [Lacticaseibacillus suihuaensis]
MAEETQLDFGGTFHHLRVARGKTLSEAADGVLSAQALSNFERNNANISFARLVAILNHLGFSVTKFTRACFRETDRGVLLHGLITARVTLRLDDVRLANAATIVANSQSVFNDAFDRQLEVVIAGLRQGSLSPRKQAALGRYFASQQTWPTAVIQLFTLGCDLLADADFLRLIRTFEDYIDFSTVVDPAVIEARGMCALMILRRAQRLGFTGIVTRLLRELQGEWSQLAYTQQAVLTYYTALAAADRGDATAQRKIALTKKYRSELLLGSDLLTFFEPAS